jgi:alpha-glucosidase
MAALRRSSAALREGGLRWVHAAGDSLVFLRESAGETVLVLCRRAAAEPLRLTGLFPETRADNLYGGAKPLYTEPDGSITIDACGPTVQVWSFV